MLTDDLPESTENAGNFHIILLERLLNINVMIFQSEASQ